MEARRVDAAQGWQWLVGGWELFIRNPAMLILYVVIWFGLSIVAAMIPFVGGLAMALIAPILLAGWFEASHLTSRQEEISASTLFEGFRRSEKTGPLITLGAILLASQLALAVVGTVFIGGAVMGLLAGADSSGAMMTGSQLAFSGGAILGLLLILVGTTVILMAYLYAVPLIWFGGMTPVEAMKSSFNACLKNVLPLLVFSLIYLILILLAILTFGLGMLVLAPVTLCAMYVSYGDLYGPVSSDTETGTP